MADHEQTSDSTGTDTLDPVALTGRLTARMRAVESARPDRLFDDPFAARLAGVAGQELLDEFGDNPAIVVRTRYFDDMLAAPGPFQICILAAGMDSRAFRLDFPAGTTVFELDRPAVLAVKAELIDAAPRCVRVPVGVDLASDWTGPLLAAGFDPNAPTQWLIEGLTQYLPESDVLRLLDRVTALSAPGSRLHMDVVGRSFLEHPAMRPLLDRMVTLQAPWLFGTDRPEDLLTTRGWRPEVILMSTVGTQFGRWPHPDLPRDTPGAPHGFLVRAECGA
ncbi:SAM-dependent methyltransferase [Nocardia sp. NPDC049149]|uniref:SAM-dependent methyltransferase n=1 Tax=Nocardia sp. NPDC049149 TaxID=3364315 RepID=UPI003718193B